MNFRTALISSLIGASLAATPALAQMPPPPVPPAAKTDVVPYLETAGMADIYEITSSQIALLRSQNAAVRSYATMLIGHHTQTTNATLAAAKAADINPPAPVLNDRFRMLIAELQSVPASEFDRVYLGQQVPSHEGALELQTAYSTNGDVPQLRATARAAVPTITDHLEQARRLQSGGPMAM